MQPRFEFIGFTPTPEEKYVGIAEVRIYGSITVVLRYKVVAKKDGSGHFPTCASYKMSGRMPGEEYDECFLIDSRSDNDAINKAVMHGFHQWQKSQQPSVFTPQHAYNGMGQPQQAPFTPNNSAQVPFIQRPEYQQGYKPSAQTVPDDNLPF